MLGSGFTAYFVPHDGRRRYRLEFSGLKLLLLRVALALILLVVAAAVTMLAFGLTSAERLSELRGCVARLEDSLASSSLIEARLERIESELEAIGDTRETIVNMTTLLPEAVEGDSLVQNR